MRGWKVRCENKRLWQRCHSAALSIQLSYPLLMPEGSLRALRILLFMSETAGGSYTEDLFSMGVWMGEWKQAAGSGAHYLHGNL